MIPAFREVTCSVCGATARALIHNPSQARGMVDAAPGVSRGTAHTRLLGVTDPDERKRAGV